MKVEINFDFKKSIVSCPKMGDKNKLKLLLNCSFRIIKFSEEKNTQIFNLGMLPDYLVDFSDENVTLYKLKGIDCIKGFLEFDYLCSVSESEANNRINDILFKRELKSFEGILDPDLKENIDEFFSKFCKSF